MNVKKILWPTDFSGNAKQAVSQIKSLTDQYDVEIHVLYVIEDIAHHESWYGEFEKARINKLIKHGREVATERLEQICSKYLDGCPRYIRHTSMGDPAQEILKLIEQEKMDVVIMPTRGKNNIFPDGSVTEEILKKAPEKVMTIHVDEHSV